MLCWVATARLMDGTHGQMPTASTGRHRTMIRPVHPSLTFAKADELFTVKMTARSRWRFPCVVSGTSGEFTVAHRRRAPGPWNEVNAEESMVSSRSQGGS